ncbi:MAG: methyltransferase domain-containing protein [Alphaproteobacteria bacterium]|nr:methyltransferase domain-containing protein [Alphaproteobacteria bacterium]
MRKSDVQMSGAVVEQDICPQAQKNYPVVKFVRSGYARGVPVPWWAKMWLKIILAHLPVSNSFWVRMGIFRHGDVTQKLANLQNGFEDHLSYYKGRYRKVPDYCLELGPGDSIGRALSGFKTGVKGTWLIDVNDFATKAPEHYEAFCEYLGFSEQWKNYDRDLILLRTNSRYETCGLSSFPLILDGSIDLSFSNAVLEHIHRDEFAAYMRELYRVHKPESLSRHWVDLHDHLGGALNNLRFSTAFWERALIYRSGFYTNRLTMLEMAKHAENAGFVVDVQRISKWESLPTTKCMMSDSFKDKSEDELNVCTFLMVLEK